MAFEEVAALERLLQEVRAGAEKDTILRDAEAPAEVTTTYLSLLERGRFIRREGASYKLTAKGVRCLWAFEELVGAYFSKDGEGDADRGGHPAMRWSKKEIAAKMKEIIER
jgi:predicted transcriptional regulator